TNRAVPHNDLPELAQRLSKVLGGDSYKTDRNLAVVQEGSLRVNMSAFAAVVSCERSREGSVKLGDLCTDIFAGATPPRVSYRSHGLRILKVRDITGEGVNWTPGERGFVDAVFGTRRQR